ncbi:MAG: hypothetical protein ACRC37_05620 [Lentisphaeria bacterium]
MYAPLKALAILLICTTCETIPHNCDNISQPTKKRSSAVEVDGKEYFDDNFYMRTPMRNVSKTPLESHYR